MDNFFIRFMRMYGIGRKLWAPSRHYRLFKTREAAVVK